MFISKRWIILGGVAVFLVSIFLFKNVFEKFLPHPFSDENTKCETNFQFINPEPDCEIYQDKLEKLSGLQKKLEEDIEAWEKKDGILRVSVFSRDLNTRRFIGVNENDSFYMASLLKLPVAVAWYKLAEVEPVLIDREIIYDGKINLYDKQNIKPEKILEVGSNYSMKELIYNSLVYSDNTAAQILFDNLPNQFIDRILSALSLQFTKPEGINENVITAKSYANIFRSLYNASYLTREYSDKILEILTETKYRDGALAKIPEDVLVAHKFAERSYVNFDKKNIKQLHDCGLVYAKKGKEPYTFCIMIEGESLDLMQSTVQDISKSIFDVMGK